MDSLEYQNGPAATALVTPERSARGDRDSKFPPELATTSKTWSRRIIPALPAHDPKRGPLMMLAMNPSELQTRI